MPSRRRWVFRIAAILFLAAGTFLLILLATPWSANLLRGEILRRVEAMAGGRLEIASVELQFFPPRVIARGIVYDRSDPAGGGVRIACGEADLSVPYRVYRGRFDRVDSLRLDHPEIQIRSVEGAAAPAPAPQGAGGGGVVPTLGRLTVVEGSVRIEDPAGGWDASLEKVNLSGAGTAAGGLAGTLDGSVWTARKGDLRLTGRLGATYRAGRRRIEIPAFQINSEADPFHGAGSVDLDLADTHPHFHLVGEASLQKTVPPRKILGDLAGRARLDLRGESREDGLHIAASVAAPELSYQGWTVTEASLEVFHRPGEVKIENLSARTLGGRVSGQAGLQWPEGAISRAVLEGRASLTGVSVEEISRRVGLRDFPMSGRVDQTGEFRMEGFDPATLDARGTARLSGRLRAGNGETVTGYGRFRITELTLEVAEASLRTSAASAAFRGRIHLAGENEVEGDLQLASSSLEPLTPYLAGLPHAARAPLTEIFRDSSGANLEVGGHLTRNAKGVTLEGRGEARSLVLRGTRLGDLHVEFSVSPSRVELQQASLSGGETPLDVTGWLRPDPGNGSGAAFGVKGKAEGVELSWIADWAGSPVPVQGKAAAAFDLSSGGGAVLGKAEWKIEQPKVASFSLEAAEGRLSLVPEGILLEDFRLSREGGVLEASGSVGYGETPALVYINGEGIRLEWLREAGLLPGDAQGEVRLQAQIVGTLQRPSVEMDLETPGLTVKGISLGAISVRVDADRQGGEFQVCPEETGVAVTGAVGFEGDIPFRADLQLEQFQVTASSFGQEMAGIDAGAVLSGSLHASGALKDASRLEVTGTLEKAIVRLGPNEMVSSQPATFHWRPPRLELTPFHMVGAGTDVELSGQLEPEGGTYLFTAKGEVALATLGPFLPGVIVGGTGAFSFTLSGSDAGTRQEGWASVQDGRLQGGALPLPLSSLEGRLVLDPPGGFHLEGVSLVAGGGKVSLEGKGTIDRFRVKDLDIALIGKDVLILAPEGFRGSYDLHLNLTQDAGKKLLAGKIKLIRGVYDRDFRLERSLLSLARGEAPSVGEEEETQREPGFLQTINLDLDLEASRGLWLINDFATLEGSARFHVGGTVPRPEVTGRFSALEGGTIRFRQVRYRVDRGNIDLVDVTRFNPSLDLLAETNVSDYQVTLRIQGELDSFTYELTSSPPLTQPEIMALLVSGRSPDTAQEMGRISHDAATSYLTSGLASGIGGVLEGVTGLDQFSIDPVYLTSQGDPASRVTMGKQISENLFAAYSILIGSSSEEIYQLEYRISHDFKFTSTREEDGSIGGDLRYLLRGSTAPREAPAAVLPKGVKIGEVRVEGEPGMTDEDLRHFLRVEPGEKLDRARLSARVEKLIKKYHRKDHWQAAVETREEPLEGDPGKIGVVLRANAGPVVRIQMEGVPSRGKRKKEIETLWSRSVFQEETPEEARAKLESSLREDGYYGAKVEVNLATDTPSLRDVILTADPGPRVRVEQIVISGNESVETTLLESLLKTKQGRGILKPEQVNADAGRIRAHYISLGYRQVRVSPPEITFSEDLARAIVQFRVVEGDPTTVAEVGIEGNQALPSAKLLEGFPVRPREPFTREKAEAGAEAIRRAYDREGYSRTKVSYELRGGGEGGPLILYRVEDGPRRLVGGIEIEGVRLTRKEVVERELTFKEGKPLSTQAIMESQRALYRLGIFSSVEMKEIEGEDPSRPTIRIQVAETKNLTQSLGIGYSTDEGVRGLYDVTNSNLMGRARTVGLQLRGSEINNRIQFLLRDPYLFNRRLDSLMSLFRDHEEHDSFTLTELGTTLQVSNKHGEKDRTIYRYLYKNDDVTDLKISAQEAGVESIRLSGFSGGFVHDSRDNFYNPRRGIFASADLAGYGERIGSQAAFLKFFAQGSLFRSIPGDSVWAQSLRVGMAYPYGNTEAIPIAERFYAGGDTTVRGFEFEKLGPLDPATGEPVGGESLIIVNEELRFPIWSVLRGVVFFDAGNVTSSLSDFNPLVLRTVLGTGFRIDTPIGPIRFEYGWKLDRKEGETPGELHITIGQAF